MFQIALCDDNKHALTEINNALSSAFKEYDISVSFELYSDGNLLLDSMMNGEEYDALFLDIEMPNINGIDLAVKIRQHYPDLLIIYVSSLEQYVFETFRTQPFRFIRKKNLARI